MRDRILTIAFLIAAAVAVGLTSTDGTSAAGQERGETAAAKRDKVKAEAKEAAQEARDYTYAQKAEFAHKMKEELVQIQEELDRLSAKVDRSSGTAKADAKAKLEVVRKKWAQAKKRLDQAEGATESTWDEVKDGFRKSYGELKDSFEKARRWLSDKIAS
jgi:outer membrane PBP1 activator LpoA protein